MFLVVWYIAARERGAMAELVDIPVAGTEGLVLRRSPAGLSLVGGGMKLLPDLSRMVPRLASGKLQREMLVRAARVRGVDAPTAVDATAGLGEDSLLLAAAGFEVTLFERDETIAALLADSLERAAADERLAGIVGRMKLVAGDSIAALPELTPDVVLLDPMFPDRGKSASAKKKLQLIQMLERPCEDEEALLQAALAAHPRKVIIKRPLKGPVLADAKPSYSLSGKAVRYDVIVP